MVLIDPVLDLVSVVANKTLNGPGCSITECADGMALDLLGQLPEHIDFCVVSVSDFEALHGVSQP